MGERELEISARKSEMKARERSGFGWPALHCAGRRRGTETESWRDRIPLLMKQFAQSHELGISWLDA